MNESWEPGLADLLDSLTDALLVIDAEWRVRALNTAALAIVGRNREDLIGKVLWDEFPEAQDSDFGRAYLRAMETGEPQMVESYYQPFDAWFEARAFPRAEGLTVLVRDVTAKHRAREEQRRREAHNALFSDVARALTAGASLSDVLQACAQALVDRLDAAFARIWLVDDAGTTLVMRASAGQYTALDDEFAQVPVGKYKIGLIAETRKPTLTNQVVGDPRIRYQDWAAEQGMRAFAGYPLTLGDRLLGVVALFSRHELHDETLSALSNLAESLSIGIERHRVGEQVAHALDRERDARRQAETANRLKDEFLATVSHELRTPLNAILGWVRLARNAGGSADRFERAMDTIERNARAQGQLIEDLLDIGRILSGKLRFDVSPIELGGPVQQALDAVRPAADAKGVRLEAALDSSAVVLGDAHRLQQVAWNLLSNAVKFTSRGGRVRVSLERNHSYVVLTVADTGRGISAAFLPHVFERFRQEEAGADRATGGLGIGLSLVQQLVEMHGGTVSAASPGERQGATFIVRLPLAIAARRETPVAPAADQPADVDCSNELQGLHILIVDDERDSRDLLRLMLEDCGARVSEAASAPDGLALLQSDTPDLLISDIGMPDMDGYAFIAQVRKLPERQGGRVPAVALTAYARVEDRARALMSGFNNHVPKPVEPVELLAVLAVLTGRTPSGPHR